MDYNKTYYDSLSVKVSFEKNIKESKLIVDRFFNGKIKSQEFRVKYTDDNEDRYWQLGKAFLYYKNGQIKAWNKVDIYNNVLIDTSYRYDKKGKIIVKMVWLNDSSFTQIPLGSPLSKVWICYPVRYREMIYKNGRLLHDITYVFDNGRFRLDGDAIFYKKDGVIDEKYIYKKGKKVK
jgi:antitoxin component YwqK of YwqJK toxin-antitoxin module